MTLPRVCADGWQQDARNNIRVWFGRAGEMRTAVLFFFGKGCRGFPTTRIGWGAPPFERASRHAIMYHGAASAAVLQAKKETNGHITDDAMRDVIKKDCPEACLAQRHKSSSFRGMQLEDRER